MKFWRIVSVVGGLLLVVLGYVKSTQQFYNYWQERAIREAANTKVFHTDCPTDNPWDCTFTEIPVRINSLFAIYIPTVGCAILLFGTIITAIFWLYRLVNQTPIW